LKTDGAARLGDRDFGYPPWKVKRSGIAAAWKANGRGNPMGIVFSAFRQFG
jgi:hypothetical protein